jgi:acyl-CoA dehydrogenase
VNDQDLIAETIQAILAGFPPRTLTPERRWDQDLWSALAAAGMTGVGIEEPFGSGGELADAVSIVATLAAGAAAVPVAEHLLVAAPALAAAGLAVPDLAEPLSVALSGTITAKTIDGVQTLSGTDRDVPWACAARHLAVLASGPHGPVLAVVRVAAGMAADDTRSLADEPRGSVVFDQTPVLGAAALTRAGAQELRARYALARAVQIRAALEQVLAWTVQYAQERIQFGRPLAKFQAVQMQLAQMAGEVTAVCALVDAAIHVPNGGQDVILAAAAAKVRAGAAVGVVAKLAHQVHGAIGYTQEYRLHHLTTRLWSWRDDAGSEWMWSGVLGAGLLANGPEGLWPALTHVV